MGTCQYCGAGIFFARTPSRALMPFDQDDVKAEALPPKARWRFSEAEQRAWPDPTYAGRCVVSHFATCPKTAPKPPPDGELYARWKRNGGRA
jgi:hypothetical protein